MSPIASRVISLASDGLSARSICTITGLSLVKVRDFIRVARERDDRSRRSVTYVTSSGKPVSLPRISIQSGWPSW